MWLNHLLKQNMNEGWTNLPWRSYRLQEGGRQPTYNALWHIVTSGGLNYTAIYQFSTFLGVKRKRKQQKNQVPLVKLENRAESTSNKLFEANCICTNVMPWLQKLFDDAYNLLHVFTLYHSSRACAHFLFEGMSQWNMVTVANTDSLSTIQHLCFHLLIFSVNTTSGQQGHKRSKLGRHFHSSNKFSVENKSRIFHS